MEPIQNWRKKESTFCPICDEPAKKVPQSAVNNFIKDAIKEKLSSLNNFHFCETPNCPVVYFKNDFTIKQHEVTQSIGIKNNATPATLCYCFDWTKEKMKEQITEMGQTSAVEDIQLKMNTTGCKCEINNPRGKCCLQDIKNSIKELTKK